jgi:hypothetical protein
MGRRPFVAMASVEIEGDFDDIVKSVDVSSPVRAAIRPATDILK